LRVVLPGRYRAEAGKVGAEKSDSGNAADGEVNSGFYKILISTGRLTRTEVQFAGENMGAAWNHSLTNDVSAH
jgi:hypothetical protein